MSLKINPTLLLGAVLMGAVATGLGACGKQGALEQPAPLFGERAKEAYAARKAADSAVRINDTRPGSTQSVNDPADPNADNAPRTSRELQSPDEDNVPASQEQVPGQMDPIGPRPSMNPPGAR